MQNAGGVANPRYEIRLLTVTIVVSALMLFLLARLRFPGARAALARAGELQRLDTTQVA